MHTLQRWDGDLPRIRPPQIRKLTAGYTGTEPRKVLEVHGPWQPQWLDLYTSRDCDGINWRWETRAKHADLAPLLDLPGLKWIGLRLRGVNDVLLASFPHLKELDLYSNCAAPLDLSARHDLAVVAVERPVPLGLDGLGDLKSLWVAGWRNETFRVPDSPNLKSLRVEGAVGGPWITELLNLEAVPALESLWLDRVLPATLEPVGSLASLERLYIDSYPRTADDLFLDLSPLADCQMLRHINVSGCRVRSFEPLRVLPRLITLFGPLADQDEVYQALHAAVEAKYRARSGRSPAGSSK